MNSQSSIVHLNVIDFAAAVAIAKDRCLAETAFVVAKENTARPIVLAVSRRAWSEGITPGMPLSMAQRLLRNVQVLLPDPTACTAANKLMEKIVARYTPLVQNDSGGHFYLDLAGTTRLFGPHIDCAVRIRNEIVEQIGLDPVVALASNKLVSKVVTRAIKPIGVAYVRTGEETAFLAHQDALLLPGVGPAMARILTVAGFREIGEIASLKDEETLALFGKRGFALRDSARGLDFSPVNPGDLSERSIRRQVDFPEPILAATDFHAALVSMMEDAGLEMRRSLFSSSVLRIILLYADGVRSEAQERSREPMVLDSELISVARRVLAKALERRVRIRSMSLLLSGLGPVRREPDLFTPPGENRFERIQKAVDTSRIRFGVSAVTRASAIAHA
jgi:DNA polymerase IV